MRIGLLVTSIGDFGQKGFYNRQEIGLAKAMDSLFDEVRVYKLISFNNENEMGRTEKIEGCKHAAIQFIPSKGLGVNGRIDTDILDKSLDVLIYFSDTQFALPKVYKWAESNQVEFFPYIGVIESHSTRKWKKWIVDLMFHRNLCVYRKTTCLVKTPAVGEKLNKLKVNRIIIAPVGLDTDLLESGYKYRDVDSLKEKYGYQAQDRIVLFIGRLVDEKRPEIMVKIFTELVQKNRDYRLLMIGDGPLRESIERLARASGFTEKIRLLARVPNTDIWELYRMADVFVNLNRVEIFGMAILEAMYYECKVVAWQAPGPNLIIENGVSGWLVESVADAIEKILDDKEMGLKAHSRVMDDFTWMNTAIAIRDLVIG